MSFFKNPFVDHVANELVDGQTAAAMQQKPVNRNAQLETRLQQASTPVMPQRITYDLIRQTIVSVRVNDLLGKGKWNKDDHLAEQLFCLVRNYEPDTKLTYERIMQAIVFVKTNDIMGAGKWTKEDHLAEYLYALVRLSGTDSNALRQSEAAEQYVLNGDKAPKKAKVLPPVAPGVFVTEVSTTQVS